MRDIYYMMIPAHYIHDLSPIIFQFSERIALRWYGLAYLAGAWGGYLLLRRFARKNWLDLPEKQVADFVTMLVLVGVLLGGRMGYLLFYDDLQMLRDPLRVFQVWKGGMASHGGMIGVGLYLLYFARRNKTSFLNLVDNVVTVVPLGLFFGRLANFINGELWGRTTQVAWGVVFPGEVGASSVAEAKGLVAAGELFPRHPSQLYEAFGEGLLLFIVLLLLRRHWGQSGKNGYLTVVFMAGYGAARFVIEFFREPDPGYELLLGWMSKGQALSLIMLFISIGLGLFLRNRTTINIQKCESPLPD